MKGERLQGVKRFRIRSLRRGQHIVSYHNGSGRHADGSDFFDAGVFADYKKAARFGRTLKTEGYVEC